MPAYLRRYVSRSMRNGILSELAFFCNDDSLSFYDREPPLDTLEGVITMRDHFSDRDQREFGVFELDAMVLKSFGLNPEPAHDEDDPVYGQRHHESVCFESIFLDEGDQKNMMANKQAMNRRKAKLALLANNNILVKA